MKTSILIKALLFLAVAFPAEMAAQNTAPKAAAGKGFPKNPDLEGLRIGMTADEMHQRLKDSGYKIVDPGPRPQSATYRVLVEVARMRGDDPNEIGKIPVTTYPTMVTAFKADGAGTSNNDGGRELIIYLEENVTLKPAAAEIYGMTLTFRFAAGTQEGSRTVREAVVEKFGTTDYQEKPHEESGMKRGLYLRTSGDAVGIHDGPYCQSLKETSRKMVEDALNAARPPAKKLKL